MNLSICTTNYNCGHILETHLDSVWKQLEHLDFEYIVVDSKSRDGSPEIFRDWSKNHANLFLYSKRCTMGEGRQIAFSYSRGQHILVVDTDVVYSGLLRRFIEKYLDTCARLSVQAVFAGIYPRDQWIRAGGRRSLNTNEDVDLWLRVHLLGSMRWYPVPMGENIKEASAWGMSDHLSQRYPKEERILRLVRREWDLLKTREVNLTDLSALIAANTIDLGLGQIPGPWPQHRIRESRIQHVMGFVRELRRTLLTE